MHFCERESKPDNIFCIIFIHIVDNCTSALSLSVLNAVVYIHNSNSANKLALTEHFIKNTILGRAFLCYENSFNSSWHWVHNIETFLLVLQKFSSSTTHPQVIYWIQIR